MKINAQVIIKFYIGLVLSSLLLVGCASFGSGNKVSASIPEKVTISVDKQQVKDLKELVGHQFTVAGVSQGNSNTTNIKLSPTAPYNGFFWIGGIAMVIGIVGGITALFKAPTIGFKWSLVAVASGLSILGATAFIKVYGALLLDLSIWALVIGGIGYLVEHNKTAVLAWLRLIGSKIADLWKKLFKKKAAPVNPPTPPQA